MDQKVCEASKRMNALQYQRNQSEERLHELRVTLKRMKKISNNDYNIDREKVRNTLAHQSLSCFRQ